jgi:hypothetical protein
MKLTLLIIYRAQSSSRRAIAAALNAKDGTKTSK